MAVVSVDLHIMAPFEKEIDEHWAVTTTQKIVTAIDAETNTHLEIVFTDDSTMCSVNTKFRGFNETTDVLAFVTEKTIGSSNQHSDLNRSDTEPWIQTETIPLSFGEVIISVPTAARQATVRGVVLTVEVSHLLLHGILHLYGYDHENSEDAQRMEAKTLNVQGSLIERNKV